MLMICREREARRDESPAEVFIDTKGHGESEEGGRGWRRGGEGAGEM